MKTAEDGEIGKQFYVGTPNIGDQKRFLDRVQVILDTKVLSNNGPYCQELEKTISSILGVPHVVATCNATSALELAIRACGLRGEVIVPSFTFIATAHCLKWMGLKPVFADIDPDTHNLDPASVKELITPSTSAILAVHCWGRPAPIGDLVDISTTHGLKLLFDASHAFGNTHEGSFLGSFGDLEVFSLHATKFVNSFEGGVIATRDGQLASKLRAMRNFGFAGRDYAEGLGTNSKMTEVNAAMGLTNLESIDAYRSINLRNYELYKKGLSEISGLRLIEYPSGEVNNFQYVVIEVESPREGNRRDELMLNLQGHGINARKYFSPGCHRVEPYLSSSGDQGAQLVETEKLCSRVMVLPTGTSVSDVDVNRVCEAIHEFSA